MGTSSTSARARRSFVESTLSLHFGITLTATTSEKRKGKEEKEEKKGP